MHDIIPKIMKETDGLDEPLMDKQINGFLYVAGLLGMLAYVQISDERRDSWFLRISLLGFLLEFTSIIIGTGFVHFYIAGTDIAKSRKLGIKEISSPLYPFFQVSIYCYFIGTICLIGAITMRVITNFPSLYRFFLVSVVIMMILILFSGIKMFQIVERIRKKPKLG